MVVTIVSASEFPSFVPDPKTAVLRIYEPIENWQADAAQQALAGWGPFLALSFWDIDRVGLGLFERLVVRLFGWNRALCAGIGQRLFGDEIPWRPFLPADAVQIRSFTDQMALEGLRSVIVVCKGARSRSWTIGRWIAERLNAEMPFERGRQGENDFIRDTLERVDGSATHGSPNMPSPPARPVFGM